MIATATELTTGIGLVALYLSALLGIFCGLRQRKWPLPAAIATAIPLGQAAFSLIFQLRFLLGSPRLGIALSLALLAYCWHTIWNTSACLREDMKRLLAFAKRHAWLTTPVFLCLLYTFAQVLFLPIKNHDALTYHLPRVFLFIQENSFFLEAFSRFHQVIFPVGSDILFYPFVALGTTNGLAIFSFSSYIAIGSAAYALSRRFASERNAATSALAIISLTSIALQAATIKNDIIMAGVAATALLLVLQSPRQASHKTLLLLAFFCAFGISIKTTFIAFIPGIGLLAILHFQLWQKARFQAIARSLIKDYKHTFACLIPILIASQAWLFIWNANHYETWSGPIEFTERNQQHDGLKGTVANGLRYGLQTLQVGSIADTFGAEVLGQTQFTAQLNALYQNKFEPYFGSAGATREPFEVAWITHEDWAWFGPLGALIFFLCIPYSLARQPKTLCILLPALGYFLIISAKISWMPWNGRFFSTFFVVLSPTLAITLESLNQRSIRGLIGLVAIVSLCTTKAIDFSNPLFPIWREFYFRNDPAPQEVFLRSFETKQNAWAKALSHPELHKGAPSSLLQHIPAQSSIALFLNGHDQHFGFYMQRPDLAWHPLNYTCDQETADLSSAMDNFLHSEIEYLLLLGVDTGAFNTDYFVKSADNYALLLVNPNIQPK